LTGSEYATLVAGPLWMQQSADMDVPRALAFPVPYVELLLGVLLVTQLFSPWPAVAAAALLLAFTVVIVRRIRDGSRPPCSCFGARSTRPQTPSQPSVIPPRGMRESPCEAPEQRCIVPEPQAPGRRW